jgi:hypothetical protein
MRIDHETPCVACPIVIRNLYATAKHVLLLADDSARTAIAPSAAVVDAVENLRIALEHMAPYVDAHLSNQDHALSPALLNARRAFDEEREELRRD